jgi:uncharacterized membrane protein
MTPIFWQIVVGVIMIGAAAIVQVYVHRYLKREDVPEEIRKELGELRSKVDYIEGKINGRHWRQGETA